MTDKFLLNALFDYKFKSSLLNFLIKHKKNNLKVVKVLK